MQKGIRHFSKLEPSFNRMRKGGCEVWTVREIQYNQTIRMRRASTGADVCFYLKARLSPDFFFLSLNDYPFYVISFPFFHCPLSNIFATTNTIC